MRKTNSRKSARLTSRHRKHDKIKEIDAKKPTVLSRVENVFKLGLPFLGTIYALGFIVVTLYLSRFGVSSQSLIETQYIVAGVLLLLSFIVLTLSIAFFWWLLRSQYEMEPFEDDVSESYWGKIWYRIRKIWYHIKQFAIALLAALFFIFIIVVLLQWAINPSLQEYLAPLGFFALLKIIGIITLLGFLVTIFGVAAWAQFNHIRDENNKIDKDGLLAASWFLGLFMVFTLVYISYFSYVIYARIPSAYGGGAPARIKFTLKKDLANKKLIKIAEDGFSESYFLLFSTDKTLVIIDPSNTEQAVEIPRDLIEGIVFNVK
jgi:hypothetical protein